MVKFAIYCILSFMTALVPLEAYHGEHSKIIALMQVRNEELFIESCLRALALYVDEIILLDDGSDDKTFEIIRKLSLELPIEEIICHTHSSWQVRTENYNRQLLLDAGRRRGGTHFIIIDADEMFSSLCLQDNWLRNQILSMQKGQMLKMPMINLWASTDYYRSDSLMGPFPPRFNKVPVVFCDDGCANYHENIKNEASGVLHNRREPLNRVVADGVARDVVVSDLVHGIVHFKSVNLDNIIIKLVWYMCLELIRMNEKSRVESYHNNAQIINHYYLKREYKGLIMDDPGLISLTQVPEEIFSGYPFLELSVYTARLTSRIQEIAHWFKKYGVGYFSDLDIWNIDWVKDLRDSIENEIYDCTRTGGNLPVDELSQENDQKTTAGTDLISTIPDTKFVVLTAAYNNKEWLIPYLESIFGQDYLNWRLIYIDDCSDDGSLDLLEAWLSENQTRDCVTIIKNSRRQGHMLNQLSAVGLCDDKEVICIVDGDDFLARKDVFSILDKVYKDGAWVTYGQFWYLTKNKLGYARALPDDVLKNGTVRQFPRWSVSHLRTFYAALYKKIRHEDLLYQGSYFPMCVDVATIVPMIEMARERVRFIPEVLLNYNDGNPLSFFHERRAKQEEIEAYIRSRPAYQRVESLW